MDYETGHKTVLLRHKKEPHPQRNGGQCSSVLAVRPKLPVSSPYKESEAHPKRNTQETEHTSPYPEKNTTLASCKIVLTTTLSVYTISSSSFSNNDSLLRDLSDDSAGNGRGPVLAISPIALHADFTMCPLVQSKKVTKMERQW